MYFCINEFKMLKASVQFRITQMVFNIILDPLLCYHWKHNSSILRMFMCLLMTTFNKNTLLLRINSECNTSHASISTYWSTGFTSSFHRQIFRSLPFPILSLCTSKVCSSTTCKLCLFYNKMYFPHLPVVIRPILNRQKKYIY